MSTFVNQLQYKTNELIAESLVYHDRTIAVLTGDRPGFDKDSARKTVEFLRNNGFYLHEVSVEEFCVKALVSLGFLLLIPYAESVPTVYPSMLNNTGNRVDRLSLSAASCSAALLKR